MNNDKKNKIPQIVVNMIETLTDPSMPTFQKELAAATLERISLACNEALVDYNETLPKMRKRVN